MCSFGFGAQNAQALSISGRVTNAAGQGVSDVKIESTGVINDGVFTDANGNYTMTGAVSGSYTLVADKDDTTFTPASLTVQVSKTNVTGANFVASGIGAGGGFTISGRVLNVAGAGVSGVKVESTGAVNDGILTDANGNYTLTGAAPGTYIITPDKINTTFTPLSRSVTVGSANVTGVNFTAFGGTAGGFTISGRVLNVAGAGVSGVKIESTGEVNDGILTDANGNYTLTGAAPGTYIITPDKINTTFTPLSRSVTVGSANVAGVNFTAFGGTAGGYTISGRVVSSAGVPVPNVRIESTGDAEDGILTDANGNYTLTGAAPGSYVITPDRDNTQFTPSYRSVLVSTANVTGVNFTAYGGAPVGAYTISGRVVNSTGLPVAGVRIESTGEVTDGILTDANGNYTLRGVSSGTYFITPDKLNTRFIPLVRSVSVTNASVTNVNFTTGAATEGTGSFTISGRVLSSAGVPVPNVRIETTGNANDGVLTDANGNYTVTGATPGTYIVTPDRDNTQFTPSYRAVAVSTANATGVNFTAYGGAPVGAYTISGRVVNGTGLPVAGVRIESTGEVTDGILTDANGNYTLRGVSPGTYIITPDKTNTRFAPQKSTVTVNAANVSNVNFTVAPA